MSSIIREGSQYKTAIPVDLAPTSHSVPSCSGNLLGRYADVYHFGAEVSSYELSDTDKLIIIASHKKPNPRIMLLTHNVDLIHKMPGKKECSLVANIITQVQLYWTHSQHYPPPLTDWQLKKQGIASKLLKQLNQLYEQERQLSPDDLNGWEQFRNHIITLIEESRNENNRLANHPFVSAGNLGSILYQCKRQSEDYEFNPFKKVSKSDQELYDSDGQNCFIWDSDVHLKGSQYSIDDCLQTIANHYHLKPSSNPKHPNRLKYFKQSIETYHRDAKDIVDYYILPKKPEQTSHDENSKNVQKTFIDPYYIFQSPKADEYLNNLTASQVYILKSKQSADAFFQQNPNETACFSVDKSLIHIKMIESDNSSLIVSYRCYVNNKKIHLLPTLDDLKTVTQASERHLYFPERAWIHFKLFFNHIPAWIKWVGRQTKRIAIEEVYDHIVEQVHRGHQTVIEPRKHQNSVSEITKEIEKSLPEGISFEEWFKQYLDEHHYVFTAPSISTLPSLYIDPLHRIYNIGNHAASLFVGLNERNPILGTLALSAYLLGGLSVIAPTALETILNSLHAHGLTHLIPIAKAIGETMSRGKLTQSISASMTLWQVTMLTGNLDQAMITALSAIKDNPAQIVIVSSLAMSLGYILCNTIPFFRKEMGDFPYTNYAAVGAKGGAAIFDTVVHPGDDWFLGTIKWILTGIRLAASLLVAPIIEGLYYGWNDGFIYGLMKSKEDVIYGLKQMLASIVDILILCAMFLLKHGTALIIHVPFRGITSLLSMSIALFGHLNDIGKALINFSSNQFDPLSSFRLSPLYGFSPPSKTYSHPAINTTINSTITAIYAPFFVLKDYILLPLTDMASYTLRLGLVFVNSLCKTIAFISGYLLLAMSFISDPTIGWLCLKVADTITISANFINDQAGQLKRQALSQAQIQRGRLYRWAFANEESKFQTSKDQGSPTSRGMLTLDYIDECRPVSTNM